MSDFKARAPASSFNSFLLVPILLLFVLLTVAVVRSPNLISAAGIGSAVIVAAPLILATYALMAVAIAGRATVDLSVGPLIGFINVTLIQLHGAGYIDSPIGVFLYAIAIGVAYQLIMCLIILFVRVQPIIVSLSGFLALSGINLVIMSRPGGSAPDWMMPWGAGTSILSPVLWILILATAGWLIFSVTAFYGHLRLMGSDERAAYTSGVRIYIVRIGAHIIAGIFSALAALTFTALIGSGDPTQGTTYTLVAVTALVLGGTSLAGGRGGVTGSLLGALNLFMISYVLATFSFGSVQGFVTDLAYGVILVASLLLSVALPRIQRYIRSISPYMVFMVLSIVFIGVGLHKTFDYSRYQTQAVATRSEVATAESAGGDSGAIAIDVGGAPASGADGGSQITVLVGEPAVAAADTGISVSIGSEPASASQNTSIVVGSPAPDEVAAARNTGELAMTVATPEAATANSNGTAREPNDGSRMASFIFEPGDSATEGSSKLARPVTLIALVMLSTLLVLRTVVAQTTQRRMHPLSFVVIASLLVLAGYFLAEVSTMPELSNSLKRERVQ